MLQYVHKLAADFLSKFMGYETKSLSQNPLCEFISINHSFPLAV